jgi:protoporphyrinogen/coproporphyrinogen III oxidase
MKRVVIVGGGITGLAIAHALGRAEAKCDVKVIDESAHLGGAISTLTHNAMILDAGPDGWLASTPHIARLVEDLGLADEVIETRPDARRVYVEHARRLHALPADVLFTAPHELRAFWRSELLGLDAKLRAGLEILVPRRAFGADDDESVYAFVNRRFGGEVADRLATPILRSTHVGDPATLSVRACTPALFEAERLSGSVLRERRLRPSEASTFVSLKRGVGDLVVNLAHKLKHAEINVETAVTRIERAGAGFVIHTSAGEIEADDVALTIPTFRVASVARDLDPELASMCSDIKFAPTAAVFVAYRKFDVRHPLDAYGVVAGESSLLACHFVSSKWEHRAPSGQVLLRVDLGGDIARSTDDAIVSAARSHLQRLLGIERSPTFAKVFTGVAPLLHVGHPARVRKLLQRASLTEGLHLGGSGVIGTSVADAVRQGFEIAARIAPLDSSWLTQGVSTDVDRRE